MALTASLYFAQDAGERRAAPRRPVERGTTLRLSDLPVDVVLHDLSETGASIETVVPLANGTTVTIGLGGVGRFEAQVISRTDSRYGCRFAVPLSAKAVASAFRTEAISAGAFVAQPVPSCRVVQEDGVKWPGIVRIALSTGIAIGGWITIIGFVRRLIDW